MKILIGVNTLTSVKSSVYSNHCQFWYRLGKNHPEIEFILSHPERMSIDRMRNISAKVAMENNCDYLMFIDDDVLVPVDTLPLLLGANADIAAGWTVIRGYPYKNMFFRYIDEERQNLSNFPEATLEDPKKFEELLNPQGLLDVDAVGFSCCIVKVELLRKLEEKLGMAGQFFVTGPFNTEDIYFCVNAQRAFPDLKMVVHPKVLTSHCLGDEYMDPLTRAAYKKYYEALYPEILTPEEQKPIEIPKFDSSSPTYEEILRKHVNAS